MRRGIGIAVVVSALALMAAAQFGAPAPPPATAAPLPLSGRAPQAGSVSSAEAVTGTGPDTLTPSVSAQGAFAGSTSTTAPFNGRLSLQEAIQRGLAYNLGAAQWANTVRQAQGQALTARSALLPNLSGTLSENEEQIDLKAEGFHFAIPAAIQAAGFNIPTVVGPFNYMDLQAALTESLVNFTSLNNYRASQQAVRANQLQLQDARNLVVLGVGGAYLGVIAAQAHLNAAEAEVATANAILNQSQQQHQVGSAPELTVNQNQVQDTIQQLQLTSLTNALAKSKIELARMIGLPPAADYQITDTVPYAPAPDQSEANALAEALRQRADLQAAAAQTEAARFAVAAAKDERLPSLSVSGDYGVIGDTAWNDSHGVMAAAATLNVPLWLGGRVGGDIESANATLAQRQAEAADIHSQIEASVHEDYLDLDTAAIEVEAAQKNLTVARQALDQTQDRFQAGVINTVELVQAQQQVATAEDDYINSVYAHNLAKLTLARDLGNAAANWTQYLKTTPTP